MEKVKNKNIKPDKNYFLMIGRHTRTIKLNFFKTCSIFIMILIVTATCTERIEIELDSSYIRLVVDGKITTDTMAHSVRISKSAEYLSNQPLKPVTNAVVTISDGFEEILLEESPDEPGYYYTQPDVYGIPGRVYSLKIENVDLIDDGNIKEYSAISELRPVLAPDSIQVVHERRFLMDWWEIRFFGQEPAETRDFYKFRVRKNGVLLSDTLTEVQISEDEFYNGAYIFGETVQYLTSQSEEEKVEVGDVITLETCGITEEYFDFLLQLMMESGGSNPFGGPPANVSTNISNGGIGFFRAYSIVRMDVIYDGE